MSDLFLRDVRWLVEDVRDRAAREHVDVAIRGGVIEAIQSGGQGAPPEGCEVIDASRWMIYPGLVNTHHHFFQVPFRNQPEFRWPGEVLGWIERIYPRFARLDEDAIYHASLVSMAELLKHGCTTAFDHQYCFPKHAGVRLIDRQFDAAAQLGMRYVAGRGANTLSMDQGGNVPDPLVETLDAYLADLERLIGTYHDNAPGAMTQIVAAPCQPMNCCEATFTDSLQVARPAGVVLHTHLGEGESQAMAARHGKRSLAWAESIGFVGEDVWVAHAWDLNPDEIDALARLGVGVSHCPAPMMLVGEGTTDVVAMLAAGVTVGLGVDGGASNDASNLAECIRLAYLGQCAVSAARGDTRPQPSDYLSAATQGGAQLLRRPDLGTLHPGAQADFFGIDCTRVEMAGALGDVFDLPARIGFGGPAAITVVQGRVVWRDGEFAGIDEPLAVEAAQRSFARALG